MARNLTLIAFDADDTLWHCEHLFHLTQEQFSEMLADFTEPNHLHARLIEVEKRNVGQYGFGVKGFILSMIETAIEVTQGRVPAPVIGQLLAAGREMLAQPIELLPGVRPTLERCAASHRLLLITKGDLLDQERKLAQSGLGDLFDGVEIVSEKTAPVYERIFQYHGHGARRAMMVGNSLKSDVVPALAAGAWGVYVPSDKTSALEHADMPKQDGRFHEIAALAELGEIVETIG